MSTSTRSLIIVPSTAFMFLPSTLPSISAQDFRVTLFCFGNLIVLGGYEGAVWMSYLVYSRPRRQTGPLLSIHDSLNGIHRQGFDGIMSIIPGSPGSPSHMVHGSERRGLLVSPRALLLHDETCQGETDLLIQRASDMKSWIIGDGKCGHCRCPPAHSKSALTPGTVSNQLTGWTADRQSGVASVAEMIVSIQQKLQRSLHLHR